MDAATAATRVVLFDVRLHGSAAAARVPTVATHDSSTTAAMLELHLAVRRLRRPGAGDARSGVPWRRGAGAARRDGHSGQLWTCSMCPPTLPPQGLGMDAASGEYDGESGVRRREEGRHH
jgi:hypothetical protein